MYDDDDLPHRQSKPSNIDALGLPLKLAAVGSGTSLNDPPSPKKKIDMRFFKKPKGNVELEVSRRFSVICLLVISVLIISFLPDHQSNLNNANDTELVSGVDITTLQKTSITQSSDRLRLRELERTRGGSNAIDEISNAYSRKTHGNKNNVSVWIPSNGTRFIPIMRGNSSSEKVHQRYSLFTLDNASKDTPVSVYETGKAAGQSFVFLLEKLKIQFKEWNIDAVRGADNTTALTVGDFNGDRRMELAQLSNDGIQISELTSQGVTYSFNLPDPSFRMKKIDDLHRFRVADVSGDGLADILTWRSDGISVSTSEGDGFDTPRLWLSDYELSEVGSKIYGYEYVARSASGVTNSISRLEDPLITFDLGDVNGDGRFDLVYFTSEGIKASLSQGYKFSKPTPWFQYNSVNLSRYQYDHSGNLTLRNHSSRASNGQTALLDNISAPVNFDGDGFANLAVWRPSRGNYHVIRSRLDSCTAIGVQQHGPGCMIQWGLSGDVPVPGDYSVDGQSDLTAWRPAVKEEMFKLADVDSDSMFDVVYLDGNVIKVARSTGKGFNSFEVWGENYFNGRDDIVLGLLDVTGDFRSDIISLSDRGIEVSISQGDRFNLPILLDTLVGGGLSTDEAPPTTQANPTEKDTTTLEHPPPNKHLISNLKNNKNQDTVHEEERFLKFELIQDILLISLFLYCLFMLVLPFKKYFISYIKRKNEELLAA